MVSCKHHLKTSPILPYSLAVWGNSAAVWGNYCISVWENKEIAFKQKIIFWHNVCVYWVRDKGLVHLFHIEDTLIVNETRKYVWFQTHQ